MREALRLHHYTLHIEPLYIHWTQRYIHFYGKRHPCEPRAKGVEAFLFAVAIQCRVFASTQEQILASLQQDGCNAKGGLGEPASQLERRG